MPRCPGPTARLLPSALGLGLGAATSSLLYLTRPLWAPDLRGLHRMGSAECRVQPPHSAPVPPSSIGSVPPGQVDAWGDSEDGIFSPLCLSEPRLLICKVG